MSQHLTIGDGQSLPPAVRAERPEDLRDPNWLSALAGEKVAVSEEPLRVRGLSGATPLRLHLRGECGGGLSLVYKEVRLDLDWTAYRTDDTLGREALPLEEPALARVWRHMDRPYLAWARAPGRLGLLLADLDPWLLDRGERGFRPLTIVQEDVFLGALASLHADFWEDPVLAGDHLVQPETRFALLGPRAPEEERKRGPLPPLFTLVERGWAIARTRLPEAVRTALFGPPSELAAALDRVPATLLHGDWKIANCAWLPGRRLAAFDWAGLGRGPATLDLGYYLAVNRRRLARGPDAAIARYRSALEGRLGRGLAAAEWDGLERGITLGGATTLLWSKALALERGEEGAPADWNWWVQRLLHLARFLPH